MTGLQLFVAVLLLVGNAFFVAAEFSAISVRRSMLEPMAEESAAARRVLNDLRSLSMLLAGAQLGITLCSLGLGAVAEPAVAHVLESLLHLLHVPEALLHPISFAIALTLVVFLHMVLGEMVPKNLSLAAPERLSLVLVPALSAFVTVTKPLILLLNGMANRGLRLLRVEPKDEIESSHTSEELAEIIAESRSEGLLDRDKHDRLHGALVLENLRARDVMIPVERLVTVPPSITAGELEDVVAETGYSRFPVAAPPRSADEPVAVGAVGATTAPGTPAKSRTRLHPARALPARGRGRAAGADSGASATATTPGGQELLGFVHAKDVLGLNAAARRQPLPLQRLRSLPAVAPDQPLTQVLTELQRLGSHLGQVQENGSTLGIIALEDVVEAFVGEVEDASHSDAGSDPQPGHAYDPDALAVEARGQDQDRDADRDADRTDDAEWQDRA